MFVIYIEREIESMYKSAKLLDDQSFIDAYTKASEYEWKYRTNFVPDQLNANFWQQCSPFPGGCKQFAVNKNVVDNFDKNIVYTSRSQTRQRMPSTELVGGVFKARGDGPLSKTDTLSMLWMPPNGYSPHCAHPVTETTFDSWQCMAAPLAVEPASIIGSDTRQGTQYITKC
jgi:hypothetical protein